MMQHRGYWGAYEFDEEESLWTGHVIGESTIQFEGSTVRDLHASLVRAVDQHISVGDSRMIRPELGS